MPEADRLGEAASLSAAIAAERAGRELAERVRAGELTRTEVAQLLGGRDRAPAIALRYLDAWGVE